MEVFRKSGENYKTLYDTFKEDGKIYQTFFKQMSQKFYSDVQTDDYIQVYNKYKSFKLDRLKKLETKMT